MSECVVRMEMPSKDKACGMVFDFDGIWYCSVTNRMCHQPDNGNIPSWCPIVCQLPEGHGRLVDADDFIKHLSTEWANGEISNSEWDDIRRWMNEETTIVPADTAERSEP